MREKMTESYPSALVNITNRCNLKCKHCFVFRDGNPNAITEKNEMPAERMIEEISGYKNKYGIRRMLWMGGEPLLRKDVLKLGVKLFPQNVIATNGTLPLIDLGPKTKWTVSIDGPEEINDHIRGKGTFRKTINNLNNLPHGFEGDLQCNSVITKLNAHNFEELIPVLMQETPIRGIVFSFYVPKKIDNSELGWKSLKNRDPVVKKLLELKKKYPKFILNRKNVIGLMFSQTAPQITKECPMRKYILPLYLGKKSFEIPFCCYGNDVDCHLCGSWGVFQTAIASGYKKN